MKPSLYNICTSVFATEWSWYSWGLHSRLYMTTRNPNPELPPDAAPIVNEVNFTTTRAGLTGQVRYWIICLWFSFNRQSFTKLYKVRYSCLSLYCILMNYYKEKLIEASFISHQQSFYLWFKDLCFILIVIYRYFKGCIYTGRTIYL